MIRVLLADNNVDLCEILARFFQRQDDIELVATAYDGEQALKLIEKHLPDVVILDITMPILDGLGVLERLPGLNLPRRPKIIILTAFGREDLILRLTKLGADYYIIKPFDMDLLATRIRQFADDPGSLIGESGHQYAQNDTITPGGAAFEPADFSSGRAATAARKDLHSMVTEIIHAMGIPAHFKGYNYIRDAVVLVLEEDGILGGNLTKMLYPKIAAKYQTTNGGVEAAIRNAIITAWRYGNRDFIMNIVGRSAISTKGRFPSNSLMIAKVADQLRLKLRAS
ncbi:MAG: sporulation transcription factor Spo0A [Syntrophothermus sp.]